MKMKTRFLLGVLLLFSITMQGQQVKVNYENITNSLPIILQEYFRMQGVQHLNLTIKGEFNGKRAKLKKISCNNGVFTDTVRLDRHKILMETYTPGDGFDIPIISYTSGISVQGGIWFCGLRDSKVEPRKWYEKYGIDDYVYYTIRLEEDKPSSKGTVYVKISK